MRWFTEQPGNGLDRVYHALVRYLPNVNVEVRGLVAGSPHVSHDSAQSVHAFASDSASLPRRLIALRKAARRVLDEQPLDLIASHFALYTFPILDLISDKPLVIHFHGPWAKESQVEGEQALVVKAKAVLERAVYRKGVRFIVLSNAFRKILQDEYGIPEEYIRIIPGGVEARHFATGLSRDEARARLGWPLDRPVILSVRRLARRMGLENLIAAMEEVRRQVPEALLFIAGKGPLARELEEHVAAAGLERHVKLLGFVPEAELPVAYRAANFSVVPTVTLEGFGLITIESLAAGTPVFVTPRGGLPETVQGLSSELVFVDHEVDTLSRRLVAALKGEIDLPSSADCQAYARTHFDWPVIAAQTRNVYEEVLL